VIGHQSLELLAGVLAAGYSLPRRPGNRQIWNGKTKPPNGAEPNAELWVEVMVETGDFNCLTHP